MKGVVGFIDFLNNLAFKMVPDELFSVEFDGLTNTAKEEEVGILKLVKNAAVELQ